MQVINLTAASLIAPDWNSNEMDAAMQGHLSASIRRYGVVVPLIVRDRGNGEV